MNHATCGDSEAAAGQPQSVRPSPKIIVGDRMRMPQIVLTLIAPVVLSAACASVRPRIGATPAVEMAVGFNMSQLPQAEFPGLTGSVAVGVGPRTSTRGVALVADV